MRIVNDLGDCGVLNCSITCGEPLVRPDFWEIIDALRDRGFPTGAEMCLWKENAHTLRESINYLASVGCRSIKTSPAANTGAWREGGYADEHDLSLDETLEIYLNYLDDFYRDLPPMFLHLGGFFAADGLLATAGCVQPACRSRGKEPRQRMYVLPCPYVDVYFRRGAGDDLHTDFQQ